MSLVQTPTRFTGCQLKSLSTISIKSLWKQDVHKHCITQGVDVLLKPLDIVVLGCVHIYVCIKSYGTTTLYFRIPNK